MKSLSLLNNKNSFASAFLILIQQLIVALSTYYIGTVGVKLSTNQSITTDLIIFCALLFVVYIPASISSVYLEKAKVTSFERYIIQIKQKLYGRVNFLNSRDSKDKVLPWINGEAQTTIERSLDHFYILFSAFFNALLNISVIVAIVDEVFIAAYITSIALITTAITAFKKYINKATDESIAARTSLRSNLLNLWDNMILGNKINQHNWDLSFNKNFITFNNKEVNLELKSQLISSAGMMMSMMPIAFCIIYVAQTATAAVLGALVLTLPRQVQILQTFHQVVTGIITAKQHVTRLDALNNSLNIEKGYQSLDDLIDRNSITINSQPLTGIKVNQLIGNSSGRFTIRGGNGSGKTCFLLELKKRFGIESYYLPSNPNNLYHSNSKKDLSTGNKILNILDEISTCSEKVVLLDEWDANLDEKNLSKIDSQIESLSQNKLIFEVRHRI